MNEKEPHDRLHGALARELATYIQHTLIAVGTTRDETIAHAKEAVEYGFDAAMVAGSWVALTAEVVKGTGVTVASALDFPTVGVMTSAGKAAEAAELVRLGAKEIDMGVQVGWLRSGDFDGFREDIAGVVRAAGVPIKVMLELPLLTDAEKAAAVELACEAGAAYLKNASSGQVEVANPDSIRYLIERAPEGRPRQGVRRDQVPPTGRRAPLRRSRKGRHERRHRHRHRHERR